MNAFMRAGPAARRHLRAALSQALRAGSPRQSRRCEACLVPQAAVEMGLPCRIGDYTDFYTSIHHATAVGKQFRPDNPLLPNYKWVPIGYHGRASSIGVSGAERFAGRPASSRRRRCDAGVRSHAAPRLRAGARHLHRASATRRASRCRSPTPRRISSVSRSSTTGRRATSRRGSTSRSVLSCRRTSRRRCRRGSSRWRRSRRFACRSRVRPAIRRRCPISIRRPTARPARSTSRSKSGCQTAGDAQRGPRRRNG